jgi:hypothetical protein
MEHAELLAVLILVVVLTSTPQEIRALLLFGTQFNEIPYE